MIENMPMLASAVSRAALGCSVLILAVLGCGPSEREIEATVEARVDIEVQTLFPPTPTRRPPPTSVRQLSLPHKVKIVEVSTRKVPVEEARRVFRDSGCLQCSTVIAEQERTADWSEGIPWGELAKSYVILGDLYGPDQLMDAILVVAGRPEGYEWTQIAYRTFENNGVALIVHEGHGYDDIGDKVKGDSYVQRHFKLENWRVLRTNNKTLFIVSAGWSWVILLSNEGKWQDRYQTGPRTVWLADLDNDGEAEVGFVDHETPVRVHDLDDKISDRRGTAETAIAQAARDFAANLPTDDAVDFENLWREHGPSASVAALALILDMPFNSLLDKLYAAVDNGEGIRDTVLDIRQLGG